MSQLLPDSSSTLTSNTAPNTSSTMNVPTSDFMEHLPLDIRLEIYSFVKYIEEPYVRFDYDRPCHFRSNLSEEILQEFDLLEPQIIKAAIMNDLDALHMLLSQITEPYYQYEAARILAKFGCLKVLQWYCQKYNIGLKKDICECAAFGGHRHIIQWIRKHDSTVGFGKSCEWAASGGHLKLIMWLHEQGCEWDEDTCKEASYCGYLDVLKYLHENGCPWHVYTCNNAVLNGDLEMLQYAHKNGCQLHEGFCTYAACYGCLDILKYAHENGCEWDEDTCSNAACYGHLDVLKYLHENGCPWNVDVCTNAAKNGHLETLKYAHENCCPWDEDTFRNSSQKMEIRNYLREHGCPGSQDVEDEERRLRRRTG